MNPKIKALALAASMGALLLWQGFGAAAQTPTATKTDWVVGSDELIRISLTNNLSILLSQIQPEIDQFSLNGLYGAYQPNLTFSATHSYDKFPSGYFSSAGLFYPATTEQINSYTPGLSGLAPWGLSYNFTGPLSEQNVSGSPDLYNSGPNVSLTQPILKNSWVDNTRYQISLSKSTLK